MQSIRQSQNPSDTVIPDIIYHIEYPPKPVILHTTSVDNVKDDNMCDSNHVMDRARIIQGASKKMHHSDFSLTSVPGVGFHFFWCVLESEFRARNI